MTAIDDVRARADTCLRVKFQSTVEDAIAIQVLTDDGEVRVTWADIRALLTALDERNARIAALEHELGSANARFTECESALIRFTNMTLDAMWHFDTHGGGWNWCNCRGDAFSERYSNPLTYHHHPDCDWVKRGAAIMSEDDD